MYYVGFSSATIIASLILFQGFNTTDATSIMSLIAGFIVTYIFSIFLEYPTRRLTTQMEKPTLIRHSLADL